MNLIKIDQKFPDELDCIKYAEKIRFGKKVSCPFCNSTRIGIRNIDHRFHCKACNKSFSVTTKTNLHNTRLPLKVWYYAFALISNAKKGMSAHQLKRDLGISYKTSWSIYHHIRDLMSLENNKILLKHIVEMDTKQIDVSMRKYQYEKKGTPHYIPELDQQKEYYEKRGFKFKEGKYKKPAKEGKHKRGEGASDKKISGAVSREGDVIAHVIKNTTYNEMRKLIDRHVMKNRKETVLLTDQAKGVNKMHKIINHIIIDHSKLYSYRGLNTNTIESFWAIIERQVVGSHHHVDIKYLEKYVAEACFKFNNRKEDDMFETLIELAFQNKKRILTN